MSLRAQLSVVVVVTLALVNVNLSSSLSVKGKVTCIDCEKSHDLSGIRVLVKCDKVKKLTVATTSPIGFFQAELPEVNVLPQSSNHPTDCFARVLGGPTQIYAADKDMVSKVVKARHKTSPVYLISTPLVISAACPYSDKSASCVNLGSSKTIDLPVPREWGLPPTSYYTPFIPIIGIP